MKDEKTLIDKIEHEINAHSDIEVKKKLTTKTKTKTSSIKTINKSYEVVILGGRNVHASANTSSKVVSGIPPRFSFKATKQQGNWVYSPTYRGWVCLKSGNTVCCKEIST